MENKLTLLILINLFYFSGLQAQATKLNAGIEKFLTISSSNTTETSKDKNSNGNIIGEAIGDSCSGGGMEQHDDGSFEESYGWVTTPDAQFVLKFTPTLYPWKYNKFCLGLQRLAAGADSMKFDIVVYDNTGAGGSPGNLIGQLLNQIARPVLVYTQFSWFSYDITLVSGTSLHSGSIYIGIRYNSEEAGNLEKYVMVDQTGSLWPGYGWGNGGPWIPLQNLGPFGNYKCLAMRTMGSPFMGISSSGNEVPAAYSLDQNYPNPFNPITHFEFGIPDLEYVSLKVYDILGNEVATLVNEKLNAGSYEVNFDGSQFPSGIYFYRIKSGNFSDSKSMILIK